MTEENNHKIITSPWTKRTYVIRGLDPTILAVFSRQETQEVRNIRMKMNDVLEDIKAEENRQKQSGTKDESKLQALHERLQQYQADMQKLMPVDEKEIENRKNVVKNGLVKPKIKTDDDYLDLGVDASFLYASIIGASQIPEDFAEVIGGLFRQAQPADAQGGQSG